MHTYAGVTFGSPWMGPLGGPIMGRMALAGAEKSLHTRAARRTLVPGVFETLLGEIDSHNQVW
jgi:hypothetical protein